MKRIATLVVLAFVATAAALTSAPDPEVPGFAGPVELGPSVSAQASVWYCPWVNAGADQDAVLLLASAVSTEASMTLPSPILNEPPDTDAIGLPGPGSRVVEVGDIVRRGDAPALVEFDDGPAAAAAAVFSSGQLAAEACLASVPKIWHLPGGTTREGFTYTVRLFNPFPDDVKVTITGASEFGAEPLPELSSIDVPGRSWRNVDLNPVVPLLDDLALVVSTDEGVVIPAAVLTGAGDQATWSGAGLSRSWTFPVAVHGGAGATLAISNPGAEPSEVTVDAITTEGIVPAVAAAAVAPGAPARIRLDDLAPGPFGVRVTASTPVAAVVVVADAGPIDIADGEDGESADVLPPTRLAATVGAVQSSTTWLLPGAGGIPDARARLWIHNPEADAVTVSIVPLGVRDLPIEKVIVPPQAIRRFVVPDDVAIASYLLEAPTPFVASWTAATENAFAHVAGSPVSE